VPAVAALSVAVEAMHGSLGFAWPALGNAGIDMEIPMRLAPLTGVYGLSSVFMTMAAALALAALGRSRLELLWLILLPFLIFLPHLPPAQRGRETALLTQPNISETEEWTPESIDQMQREQVALTVRGVLAETRRPPSLVVWPEEPAPLYYEEDPRFRSYADNLARATHAYLLIGLVAHTPGGAPLNSTALISPAGSLISRYDRVNLVPFREYVSWPFGFANKISIELGDFVRSVLSRGQPQDRRIHLLRIRAARLRALVRGWRRRIADHELSRRADVHATGGDLHLGANGRHHHHHAGGDDSLHD
jgi:apolipoprotein N-acyltransferase